MENQRLLTITPPPPLSPGAQYLNKGVVDDVRALEWLGLMAGSVTSDHSIVGAEDSF